MWNIKRIQEAKVVDVLRGRFPESEGIGIYGSWAHGTNFEGADLDIWLSMKKEPEDLKIAKARRELEERAGVPVDITTATPERLKHFREKSEAFYFSLYNGLILWGEGLD